MKNRQKLECYMNPMKEGFKMREFSSGSRSKSKKGIHDQIANRNKEFNLQLQYDMAKHYKHIKSNSEAATKYSNNLNESGTDTSANVYANKRSLKLQNYSPDKKMIGLMPSDDQNVVIFSNDFNTVKYSQSPFLNKLTNLKQKMVKKQPQGFNKGHKSRNSMFPRSYTEIGNFRREPDIGSKNIFMDGMRHIPEEPRPKIEESKHSNPYSNIEVENEVHSSLNPQIISAYGNEQKMKANMLFKDCDNKIKVDSDRKRAPTVGVGLKLQDTTRSKTGIDASNDSGKGTPGVHRTSSFIPKSANDTNHSHKGSIPISADKVVSSYPYKRKKSPSDYYQMDAKAKKRDEIISILSMEIGESEGLSHSYSQGEELGQGEYRKHRRCEKAFGAQSFENQKTQKQNIQYLQDQINIDPEPVKPVYDNFNVINYPNLPSKAEKFEYRERLDEETKRHKKAKSQRSQKHQYIRNNHEIITRHQKHRSTDSTDNSILKKSNGFEILYKRGEKLEKLLDHHESVESSYSQDETSSISEIGNSKAVEISYRSNNDMI